MAGRDELPATFVKAGPDAIQEHVFDPALKHYDRAFRPGEPAFSDTARHERWLTLRRVALDRVLGHVADAPFADRLVLRGSFLLRTWLGDDAREPGDLDFVVTPASLSRDAPDANFLDALLSRIGDAPRHAAITLLPEWAVRDDLWTYEKAPGRRLVIPWLSDDGYFGAVQIDLVWNEPIPSPPRRETLTLSDGREVSLLCASPEQSLAWKLLWLSSDMWPQGKDLYDAVLLAERYPLDAELLARTLDVQMYQNPGMSQRKLLHAEDIRSWDIDWYAFLQEYPDVGQRANRIGGDGFWQSRLAQALAATFAQTPTGTI